jgi:hypothetical protein
VRDDAPAPGVPRAGVRARVLALWGGLLALLLTFGATLAYRGLIRYERRAIEHVPAGAELAVRVDLEQLVLFGPFRENLLALVDRAPLGWGAIAAPGRLARLREQGGLNLGLDLRELVVARAAGGAWLLALGGIFGDRPLLPGIESVLRAEPGAHLRSEGAMLILEPSGLVLSQAEDGILLIGSDAEIIQRAMPHTRVAADLGLGAPGAAAAAATPGWVDALPWVDPAAARSLPLRRVTARLDYGDPFELTLELELDGPADLARAREIIDTWFGAPAHAERFAPRADWGGERAVMARAQLTSPSPGTLVLMSTWQRGELARASRSLATWLEGNL